LENACVHPRDVFVEAGQKERDRLGDGTLVR